MSLSGVSTEVWGPCAWKFMHAISFRYPTPSPSAEQRQSAYDFLASLKQLLPCVKCRHHFTTYFDDPVDGIAGVGSAHLQDRQHLSRWLVALHNDVNRRLDKPQMAYSEVAKQYAGDYVCPASKPFTQSQWCGITTLLVTIITILVMWLLHTMHKQSRTKEQVALAVAHLARQ